MLTHDGAHELFDRDSHLLLRWCQHDIQLTLIECVPVSCCCINDQWYEAQDEDDVENHISGRN